MAGPLKTIKDYLYEYQVYSIIIAIISFCIIFIANCFLLIVLLNCYPTDAATSSQTLRLLLLTVIFAVTPWLIANLTFTSTSWPPRNTPDKSNMCEFFLVSTVSERSHGCMPINAIICLTASAGMELQ